MMYAGIHIWSYQDVLAKIPIVQTSKTVFLGSIKHPDTNTIYPQSAGISFEQSLSITEFYCIYPRITNLPLTSQT